jgi:hypothetical protein
MQQKKEQKMWGTGGMGQKRAEQHVRAGRDRQIEATCFESSTRHIRKAVLRGEFNFSVVCASNCRAQVRIPWQRLGRDFLHRHALPHSQ